MGVTHLETCAWCGGLLGLAVAEDDDGEHYHVDCLADRQAALDDDE